MNEENVTPIFAPHALLRVKVNMLQCVVTALSKAEGNGELGDDAGAGGLARPRARRERARSHDQRLLKVTPARWKAARTDVQPIRI